MNSCGAPGNLRGLLLAPMPLHRRDRDLGADGLRAAAAAGAAQRTLHVPPLLFFSILQRRLLRRGEFDSVDDLADRIIASIKDSNRRAAPSRWTYDGPPQSRMRDHND